jgi:hypothetical protein
MNTFRKNKIIPCSVPEKERIEKFVQFAAFFNKFINHRKKHRRPFLETDMRI